jgi:hypothetical protein
MSDETILIKESMKSDAETTTQRWSEEISVRSGDLADTLGRLGREATVRKITLKNAAGKTMAEIPMVVGAAGMLVLGPWTAALLVAAWLGRVSIIIDYEEAPATMQAAVKEVSGSLGKSAAAIEANIKSA